MADGKKVTERVRVETKDGLTFVLGVRSANQTMADEVRQMLAELAGGPVEVVVPVPEPEKPQS